MIFRWMTTLCLAGTAVSCASSHQNVADNSGVSDHHNRGPIRLEDKIRNIGKKGGTFWCDGVVDKNLVRTWVQLSKNEKLERVSIAIYRNAEDPDKVPNQLATDLKKYEIYSNSEIGKYPSWKEVELNGKKLEFKTPDKGINGVVYQLEINIENDSEITGGQELYGSLKFSDSGKKVDVDNRSDSALKMICSTDDTGK